MNITKSRNTFPTYLYNILCSRLHWTVISQYHILQNVGKEEIFVYPSWFFRLV